MQLGTLEAYNALVRAEWLIADGAGYLSVTPITVTALRKLVRDGRGDLLARLCRESPTVAGRLHGLCGLAALDSAEFEVQARQFDGKDWFVKYQYGCLGREVRASTMVEDFRKGPIVAKILGASFAQTPN